MREERVRRGEREVHSEQVPSEMGFDSWGLWSRLSQNALAPHLALS